MNCIDRFADLVLDIGVHGVAGMAHRRRQIARPDKDRVHAGHGGDGGNLVDRFGGLDLHDDALRVCICAQVIRLPRVVIGANRSRDAAQPFGRVAGPCHGAAGVLGCWISACKI